MNESSLFYFFVFCKKIMTYFAPCLKKSYRLFKNMSTKPPFESVRRPFCKSRACLSNDYHGIKFFAEVAPVCQTVIYGQTPATGYCSGFCKYIGHNGAEAKRIASDCTERSGYRLRTKNMIYDKKFKSGGEHIIQSAKMIMCPP